MADISAIIRRKSLQAKQKAAIKTLKAQTKDRINQIKTQWILDDDLEEEVVPTKEQKIARREQKKNAMFAYAGKMPREYTIGEDIYNSISHGIAAGLTVAALIFLVLKALQAGGGISVFYTSMFGASLFTMYIVSTLYHALTPYGARNVFSILTHDAIYILISGTATPFLLKATGSCTAGWILFSVLWAATIALIAVYSSLAKKVRTFSMIAYVVMGWLLTLIFAVSPVHTVFNTKTVFYLMMGSLCYSVGCLFFMMTKYKWFHSIFHTFCIVASALHFISIWNLI